MGILVEGLDVEVGIRGHEIKHIIFLLAEPVFPSDVPSLDEELVHTVGGGEIYIAAHILIVSPMSAMRCGLGVIESGEVEILGITIRPRAFAGNHLPPYTHILDWRYP